MSDVKALRRAIETHGFGPYSKDRIRIIYGQHKYKVYFDNEFVGSLSLNGSVSKSMQELRDNIAEIEKQRDKAAH